MDPKTVFEHHIEPKNSPLEPKIVKNKPKIKSKSNVRIEGNIENKSCCTIWVDPKTISEPDRNTQNSTFGPKKAKTTLKLEKIG